MPLNTDAVFGSSTICDKGERMERRVSFSMVHISETMFAFIFTNEAKSD